MEEPVVRSEDMENPRAVAESQSPKDGLLPGKAVIRRAAKGDGQGRELRDWVSSHRDHKASKASKKSEAVPARALRSTKLKFCMYHLQGVCRFSSEVCEYAHSLEEKHDASRLQSSSVHAELQQEELPKELTKELTKVPSAHKVPSVIKDKPRERKSRMDTWVHLDDPIFLQPKWSRLSGVV
mmetsp:Transcript_22236/g.49209  ORF Transcript_22236/g.49209 Transcript_22236/m.49209 type:complete len:182 (+) Transcript_22236:37-582(+)